MRLQDKCFLSQYCVILMKNVPFDILSYPKAF